MCHSFENNNWGLVDVQPLSRLRARAENQPPSAVSSLLLRVFFLMATSKASNDPCWANMRLSSSPQHTHGS